MHPDVSVLDLSLANYDMVMPPMTRLSRPDPFTGRLWPLPDANYYAQMPFNQASRPQRSVVRPASQSRLPATCFSRRFTRSGAREPAGGGRFPDQPDRLFLRDRQPLGLGALRDKSH